MDSEDFIQLDSEEPSGNVTGHISTMISDSNVQRDHSTDTLDCADKKPDVMKDMKDLEPENHAVIGCLVSKNSFEVNESCEVVDKTTAAQLPNGGENGCSLASVANRNDQKTSESPITGVKRARVEAAIDNQFSDQPSVHVIYNSLTRESKKKLKELLEQWSQWHARHESSVTDPSKKLEHGEETYFPALNVGGESSFTVTFWVDSQTTKDENKQVASVNSDTTPLYDRGCVLGTTVDGQSNNEREERLLASRCFNCASYGHSLRDCPKPRDNVAINNARKQQSGKKSANTSANWGSSRYYLSSSGKFDDLKPGVLSSETRGCLGIGELDPPPWLQRMREIGYPPGYLDVKEDEDQPSGITIFGAEDTKPEYEDGELPERGEPIQERMMTVEFPGINAPIPENADEKRWASMTPTSTGHHRNRFENSSTHHSDPHRGLSQDLSRNREHGSHNSLDNTPGSSHVGYSQRYSPYNQIQSPTSRSPILGRSLSDRWGSPLAREGPRYGPPSPLYPGNHSLPSSHHSPSFERWEPNSPYGTNPGANPGGPLYGRDREHYDPHRHHHHHQRR